MGQRKIIWLHRAEIRLFKIPELYAERNKSKTYSAKLYQSLNKELQILLKQPDIGLNTEMESVRGLIIDDYILFYEYDNKQIVIHSIWDCRQNPDDILIKQPLSLTVSLFLPASENFVEIVFPFAKEYLRITEQVTPEVTPEVDMPGNDMVGPIVTMQVTMQVRELIKSQQLLRAKPVPH